MFRAIVSSLLIFVALPAFAQSTNVLSKLRDQFKFNEVSVGTGTRTDGSGHLTDDVRAVSGFAALSLEGPIDVELRSSSRERVTVQFDDNLQQSIEVKLVSDAVPTLQIKLAPNAAFTALKAPRVLVEFVTMNDLTMRGSGDVHADLWRAERAAVSMNGSGDLRIENLDVPVLAVAISGSGDFSAAGKAEQQAYSIRGSGDVGCDKLIGRVVKVQIAGSGDATVNASKNLEVVISGSGDVSYVGDPALKRSITGSGSISRAN